LVEDKLLREPWVFGDRFTVADGYLSVFTRWARQAQMLDPTRFPKLNAHLDRVQARPAVRRVLEAEGLQPV
jgi:glutathione S-transferase